MEKNISVRTSGGGDNYTSPYTYPDIDVFYNPELAIIGLYVAVLVSSLFANTLLIVVVIKFQYMRRAANYAHGHLNLHESLVRTSGGGDNYTSPYTYPDIDVFYNPELAIIGLYVAVLVSSLFANTLLIVVVIKFQYMRSVTNIFLVNLSVADLLVTLFCMPVQISKAVTVLWYFGEITCKVVNFLQGVAVAASVFTITAMSVDRYLAITQSLRQPWMPSRRGALFVLLSLWLVALAIFSPILVVATVEHAFIPLRTLTDNGSMVYETRISFCTERWPDHMKKELFGTFSFVLVYAVPGSIMVVAYSLMGRRLCSVLPPFDQTESSVNSQQRLRLVRERKRVALILLLLAVLFAMCWLPYNIILLLLDTDAIHADCVAKVLPYTLLLGHANSAINPIVYCLMTRNFRRSLRKLVCQDATTIGASQKFHLQDLRQKSSSMRTRSTVTMRSTAPANRSVRHGNHNNYAPIRGGEERIRHDDVTKPPPEFL